MPPRLALALSLGAALSAAGCTDAEPIEEDVCGNGILESGEDCDVVPDQSLGPGVVCGRADSEAACRYTCAGDASCPIGWECGRDTVCRRAIGRYQHVSTATGFGLTSWEVVLGDNDELPDILGTDGARVALWRGDGTGLFVPQDEHATAAHVGPAAVVREEDGPVLYAPVDFGRLSYRVEAGGRVVPRTEVAFAANVANRVIPIEVPGRAREQMLLLSEDDPPVAGLSLAFLDPARGASVSAPLLVASDRSIDELAGGQIPTANLEGEPDLPVDELGLAFSSSPLVRIYRAEHRPDAAEPLVPVLLDVVTMPGPVGEGGVLFADTGGDGVPDLLADVGAGVYVARGRGDGTFYPPRLEPRFDGLVEPEAVAPGVVAGSSRFPLAAADLDGDGLADFVGENGLFLTDPASGDLRPVYRRGGPHPWAEAAVADLDGALGPEVAVRDGAGGVELVRQLEPETYAATGVTIGASALGLLAGDFNGDAVADVAFLGSETPARWPVSILYGGGAAPSVATPIATYPREPVWKTAIRGGFQPDGSQVETLLLGLAPDNNRFPAGVVLGLENQRAQPLKAEPGRTRGLAVSGGAAGSESLVHCASTGSHPVLFDDVCTLLDRALAPEPVPARMPSELACSYRVTGDVDADGRDELVSLYPAGCAGGGEWRVHIVYWAQTAETSVPRRLEGLSSAPSRILLADLTGDGREDLVVATDDEILLYSSSGEIAAEPRYRVDADATGDARLDDVGAIQLDTDPEQELLALDAAGVVHLELEGDSEVRAERIVRSDHRASGRELEVADVNRDGVDDVLIVNRNRQELEVYQGLSHTDSCALGEEVLYLNDFPGAVRPGADDVAARTSSLVAEQMSLAPYPYSRESWDRLVACVRDRFAPFNVRVVEGAYPEVDGYNEVAVTATGPEAFGLEPGIPSLAVQRCEAVDSTMAFVFVPPALFDEERVCHLIAAAAGSMYGLEWTVGCDNIMGFDQSCREKEFRDAPYACGRLEPAPCECGGTSQNSFRRLEEQVGLASCGGTR